MSEQENTQASVDAIQTQAAPAATEQVDIGQSTVMELFGDGAKPAKQETTEVVQTAPEQKKETPAEKSTSNEAQPEKQKPSRYEQNIGKMHRINGNLTRENAKLKERIAELESLQSATPDTAGMSERQAAVAEATHAMKVQRAQERVAESEESLVSQQNEYYHQLVSSQIPAEEMGTFMDDYNKYSQDIAEHEPEIMEAFKQSAFGPLILREFFNDVLKNQNNLNTWVRLNPFDKRMMISNLVTRIQSGHANAPAQQQNQSAPQNVQQRSSAPTPIVPSSRSSAPGANDGDWRHLFKE